MTSEKYQKGSEWRKWDLHIHTPASFHWNGGKRFSAMTSEEKNTAIAEIVTTMNNSDVCSFCTMDYWTFDGYMEICKYLRGQQATKLNKVLFPGMELRIEAPTDFRLNIHVILSNKLTEQQLADFKSKLIVRVIDRPLSDDALIQYAKKLDKSKAQAHGYTDDKLQSDDDFLSLGSKTAEITKKSLEEAITVLPIGSALIIMPYDTSDGLEKLDWKMHPADDLYFMQGADIFETRSPDNVDLFLGRKTEKNKNYFENFLKTMGGKPKPALSGSDAHKISDYGKFYGDRVTWIKANPTFEGLMQLTIEPLDRCFIGRSPEKLQKIDANKTKFIQTIAVGRSDSSLYDEIWFNNTVSLNPELVAIIGNKGSGKSALADIIGLVANSNQHEFFSFLTPEKFREKKSVKASKFKATLTWESGNKTEMKLDAAYDPLSVEMVKYIPQNYLEKICNETALHSGSLFNNELKDVIFSHIDTASRLGHKSLDDLMEYKTDEVNQKIEILKDELGLILQQIVECEAKLDPGYEKNLINKLSAKNAEMESHKNARPPEVKKPDQTNSGASADNDLAKEITDLRDKFTQIESQIQSLEVEKSDIAQRSALSQKVLGNIDNLKKQMDSAAETLTANLTVLGLQPNQILTFSIQREPVVSLQKKLLSRMTEIENALNASMKNSPAEQKVLLLAEIQKREMKLDEPNKLYREYQSALQKWDKTQTEIIGSQDAPGSITNLNGQIAEIKEIPSLLSTLEEKRDSKVKEIFDEVFGLATTYRDLYTPVQQFVESNPIADERFKMQFDVSIMCIGFKEAFFDLILRNVVGSFYGSAEGEKVLSGIIEKFDFSTAEQLKQFTHEIIDHLRHDCRPKEKLKINLSTQVKKGDVLNLYKYIFSLSYLKPEYALKLNGKSLAQLSPGERGTLLLIFYLMVDRDTRPIILDQPEENLDNQTIYKVLVPCIKQAKKIRQIILVTHNPNLAVVCDAEQIIVAHIDKQNKNEVKYLTGAIESPAINHAIVDILEGTRPAFDNRDLKYH